MNIKRGPCVFILRCRNERFYIGSTQDLTRRIIEHNTGKTRSLKHILSVEVIFQKCFDTVDQARKIEYKLKKFKRKDILNRIIAEDSINCIMQP